MKVLGYTDRLSVMPGDTLRFMVSCEAETYQADIVRLIHGTASSLAGAGPGGIMPLRSADTKRCSSGEGVDG